MFRGPVDVSRGHILLKGLQLVEAAGRRQLPRRAQPYTLDPGTLSLQASKGAHLGQQQRRVNIPVLTVLDPNSKTLEPVSPKANTGSHFGQQQWPVDIHGLAVLNFRP